MPVQPHQHISNRERDDAYVGVVANLDDGWRVITCRHGLQWVLQTKNPAVPDGWRCDAFCQSRRALLRIIDERGVEVTPTSRDALSYLPSHFSDAKVQEPSLAIQRHSAEVSDA